MYVSAYVCVCACMRERVNIGALQTHMNIRVFVCVRAWACSLADRALYIAYIYIYIYIYI